MSRLSPIVFLLVGLIPAATFSGLQDRSVPEAPTSTRIVKAQLDPIAVKLNELAARFPNSQLIKRFNSNDATRLLLDHFDKPLKISALDNGAFEIRLTREFSSEDIDGLADHHPELLKYAAAFPRQTQDNVSVKITIETEVTCQFENECEFEENQAEICEIYRAFKDAPLNPITVNPVLVTRLATSGR